MATFIHKDFSAGWCPSDSPTNGRPNGLLHMDGVELDQNGDLIMTGGIKTIGSAYISNAHTIFSKFLNTAQHRYLALKNGDIYRNNTLIATGGSATRAAFGYAFDYVLAFSGVRRIKDTGSAATDIGQVKPSAAPTLASAGAGVLTGVYEYIQMNVFSNGAYIAKSTVGPSSTITATSENINVTGQNPTAPANEIWIFRRGGNLDEYYRVRRITSSYNTLFVDNVTDDDALDIGITLDLLSLSVNSTDLPDDILAVVGPINRRMLYFTKKAIIFSEVNSPESYNPNKSINYSDNASGTEVFLWAKKVNEDIVLIGTTHEIYRLTGTYITLPDDSIDANLRGTGTKFPPIGLAVDVYQGGVCYMSSNGWRLGYPNGTSDLLVDERLDRLYRGNSILNTNFQNGGIPIYLYPATDPLGNEIIYDCAVARDKLHCRMPQINLNNPSAAFGSVGHVYDFKRQYWRTGSRYEKLYAQEDGALLGFDYSDSQLKEIEYQFLKSDNGALRNVDLLFPVWDYGLPDNRKFNQTLKIKTFQGPSGSSSLAVKVSINDGLTFLSLGNLNAPVLDTYYFDISILAVTDIEHPKTLQVRLHGLCEDFQLCYIGVEYEPHPVQTVQVNVQRQEYPGIDGKRFRPRTWPFIIDTLGHDIYFTPFIDGVAQTSLHISSTRKQLFHYFFKTDVPIPVDLGYKITGGGFELYGVLPPEVVHIFPMAKQFDQLGPEHFFRYGKIKALVIRLFSDFNGDIPYQVFFQDASSASGVISVVEDVEDTYEVPFNKTTAGQIIRVELGPTNANFYRYYAQIQVTKSGRDTDMEWVTVGLNNV